MFSKILVANRGEIACRVIKTARRLGVKTVAVYSDADAKALHVRMADEACRIGPPPASESYLLGDEIIRITKEAGAEAIHPGYGFLSENAGFSRACDEAGITFIGPKPKTVELMGSKALAKQLMEEAGVPLLPGYQGEDQSLETFKREAERIGYPVLLKAAAGGGGKGMRIVERAEDLDGELESAKREAKSAFGDDRFIVEKFLAAPRHVEVQVFGDTHGNIVHLFERDCSVQRRYQKVVEEAPAPDLPDEVREELHRAAVEAARKVDYVGAGTVEFLYDGANGVYFMEMNTRLQVEHPVTEEITGQDLVEWQLRVAAGEKLPLTQGEITAVGHAVEARLYAEDPYQNYLPQTGRLLAFDAFEEDYGLRVDTGVEAGDAITSFYDPMIAKVIAWRESRDEACDALAVGLASLEFKGFGTNRDQLVRILQDSGFAESVPTTKFLPDRPELSEPAELSDLELVTAAVFCHLDDDFAITSFFGETLGFRLNAPSAVTYVLENQGEPVPVTLRSGADGLTAEIGDRRVSLVVTEPEEGVAHIEVEGKALDLYAGRDDAEGEGGVALETSVGIFYVRRHDPFEGAGAADGAEAALSSPMPATVTNVLVSEGDEVEPGQPLLTLEAMKMETVIKAPHGGKVSKLHFAKGDSAAKGALLLELEQAS